MDLFNLETKDFQISTRTKNILLKNNIEKLSDFESLTIKDIKNLKGLGASAISEVREFLSFHGVKLKVVKAPKKEKSERKYSKNTKEILVNILGDRVNNFSMNMKMCGKMIEAYGEETMRNFKVHDNINNLFYYFSAGEISPWVDEYVLKFAPIKITESQIEEPQKEQEIQKPIERVEYIPMAQPQKPRSLSEFLSKI